MEVEEQWGSGLQELLQESFSFPFSFFSFWHICFLPCRIQDLNPDVPRFGLENLKSGVWLFDTFAFLFWGSGGSGFLAEAPFHAGGLTAGKPDRA